MPSSRPVSQPTPQRQRAKAEYQQIPSGKHANDPKGFVKHPHAYGQLISGGKLGGALQRDLIYWIEFYTFGQEKRPEWAKLSLTALAKLCQVWDDGKLRPVERKSVATALADLEKRNIIEARDRKGCGPTTAKMYKVTPERWKAAPPYIPPTPKELEEIAAAEDAEEIEEPASAPQEPTAPATVAPGKSSRPVMLAIALKGQDAPVRLRVEYHSDFDQPLTFRSFPGANGRLRVSVCRPAEQKANGCSRTQPQFANPTVENKRFKEFDTCVNSISLDTWGIALEDALITRIAEAAGAAPVATFERIARKKLSGRNAARDHKPGLLVNLAEQASRSHAKETAINAAREAERPAPAVVLTDEELRAAEGHELAMQEARERHAAAIAGTLCDKCKGTGSKDRWINSGGVYGPKPFKCGPCNGTGRIEAAQ
jgi:hypothetical protein